MTLTLSTVTNPSLKPPNPSLTFVVNDRDETWFISNRQLRVVGVDALSGETFWVAFRDSSLDETRPPLSALVARGYRVGRVYERPAQRQRAFLVRLRRVLP